MTARAAIADDSLQGLLNAMEQQGADQFDSVRFHYIQSLVNRSGSARPAVAEILQNKAAQALNDYKRAFIAASDNVATDNPAATSPLKDLLVLLEQRVNADDEHVQGERLSLTDYLRQQEKAVLSSFGRKPTKQTTTNSPRELSSVRAFRESLVKVNSDKLVTQVISEGPENPGPLNPQALVIKSLATMRELSPDYLNRFVSYIDTLLWLEQASAKIRPAKTKKNKRSRKR